jgi:hypothetical protein
MAKTLQAVNVRSMHTGIHHLFVIDSKPKTVLKAFKALSKGVNEDEEQYLWFEVINKNTSDNFEINYRFIENDNTYVDRKGQKYKIINDQSIDVWGF